VSVVGSTGAVVAGADSTGVSLLVVTGEPSTLDVGVSASETGQTVVETATVCVTIAVLCDAAGQFSMPTAHDMMVDTAVV
jgi:hypothetical protein